MARVPDTIRYWRNPDGSLAASIKQRHQHHSDGFEVGYGGSGPADFALNILALLIPIAGGERVKCHDGTHVSQKAWDLHQRLKWEIISHLDPAGGEIPIGAIRSWIYARDDEALADAALQQYEDEINRAILTPDGDFEVAEDSRVGAVATPHAGAG